jgi:hypothetical protein
MTRQLNPIIKTATTYIVIASWLLSGWPGFKVGQIAYQVPQVKAITCGFGTEIGSTGVCRGFLTTTGSNQTWTSPADWNNSNNTIECIGGGASGGASYGSTTTAATGGGAGAYSLISNFSVATPGTTQVTYRVGAGGEAVSRTTTGDTGGNAGGDSWFNDTAFPGSGTTNVYCGAKGGSAGAAGAVTQNGGAGGVGTDGWGQTRRSGGAGGNATHTSNATGGGGAAGNSSTGGDGVASSGTGSATAGGQANGTGATGGAGTTGTGNRTGDNGNNGTEYTSQGSGGGGGGARTTQGSRAATGGNGGSSGGGGGGSIASSATATSSTSGTGTQGIIVITYTPLAADINLSGTIYQSDGSTAYDCSSTNLTVNLRVNGAGTYSASCTASSGAWSVTGISASSGDTIYAYLSGGSTRGSTVLVTDNTTQTNLHLIQNRVLLRDDNNGTITNAEILAGNTSDADDLISFSGSDLTVAASYQTHIYTGDTYTPGANVSTGSLRIDTSSTFSAGTNTLTLTSTSGTLLTRTGTFTQGTGEVVVTSASGTPTLLSAATTLHKLTINSAATVINNGAALTINNATGASFTLTAGVFNVDAAFTGPGYSNGSFTLSADTTFCLGGTTNATNATCDSGATQTAARDFPAFVSYSLNAASTVRYLSDAAQTVEFGNYGNLVLAPKLTAARTYTMGSGTATVNGDFTINPSASSSYALTVNMAGAITVAATKTTTITGTTSATSILDTRPVSTDYTLTTGLLNIGAGGHLDGTSSSATIIINGTSGTLFTRSGSFTRGTTSVRFTGDASATLTSGNHDFYNLQLQPTLTTDRTYTFGSGTLSVYGDFLINPTAVTSLTLTVNPGNHFSVDSCCNLSITGTTSGRSTLNLRPASTDYNYTGGGLMTYATGTLNATSASSTISLTGTFVHAGTFTPGNSTVVSARTGNGNFNSGSITMYNFTVNNSGGSVTSILEDPIVVTNNLTITTGILDTHSTENNQITVGGNFTNNGTFTARSGTVIFNDNTKTSALSYSAATSFYNLTVSTAGKAMQFDNADQTNVTGTLTIQGSDCTTGRVFLDSTVNDDQFALNATGTVDIDYADIEDSNAIAALTADNSTEDNNNNTNWTINAGACEGEPEPSPTPTPTNTPTPTLTPVPGAAGPPKGMGGAKIRGGVQIK